MNKNILKVAIRNSAIYIKDSVVEFKPLTKPTTQLVANCAKLGFGFSEELLRAINTLSINKQKIILEYLNEIMGVEKNWTPLVKGWDEPTEEGLIDHLITYVANLIGSKDGVELPCGHIIPENTFPIERYNGCPFCGEPFEFDNNIFMGQNSKLKILKLWGDKELYRYFNSLLLSKTPLDATKKENLKLLTKELSLPKDIEVEMIETKMLLIESLIEAGREDEAGELFDRPNDIMRYLWYKHTGYTQIVQPKVINSRVAKNSVNYSIYIKDAKEKAYKESVEKLKLKYSRQECKMVAKWLNNLSAPVDECCENMHPKRSMWVRFIRALRLVEYSKKRGFTKLKLILDSFYNQKYTNWRGEVDRAKLSVEQDRYFYLLKQRPGEFARRLFSSMLWFGDKETIAEFEKIANKVPARLLVTLSMYANLYFDKNAQRSVKPLGSFSKKIGANSMIALYEESDLVRMRASVEELFFKEMTKRYQNEQIDKRKVYVDKTLSKIPLDIGDRAENIQDLPSIHVGERLKVEGSSIRLFMQWGVGLKAQHLDMDLSCRVVYKHRVEDCSYYNLRATGCKHSGDIQRIPHMIGTAEYIEIDINDLQRADAKYVVFTGNAYTSGSLEPNMSIGWMSSEHKMKISKKSGVAYDPSCVQHQIKVTKNIDKGLVFGVLDVANSEIIWLEMSFSGQRTDNLDLEVVETLIAKIDSKMSVGELLNLKINTQKLELTETKDEAEMIYDRDWVKSGGVAELLID